MQIKNYHGTALTLPDGTTIGPGATETVTNAALVKKNAVVQGWLKAKVLSISGGESSGSGQAAGGNPGGEGGVDKDALIARAKELGIDAKGTWGVPKLEAAIAEAEAKAAANGNPGGEG